MVEYVILVAAILVVAGALGYLVAAAHKSADRTEALVSAECP
jgi:hypothetical protein